MKSMQGLSDAALINAYKKGNLQAFEIILSKYKDPIYQTIYMLVRDIALAEDLFQEVFIKIIQTIRKGNYTEEGKFLPWACRIARNLCMDYFRKQKATALKTLDAELPMAKNYSNQDLNTLQLLEQSQSAAAVHDQRAACGAGKGRSIHRCRGAGGAGGADRRDAAASPDGRNDAGPAGGGSQRA